MRIYTFGVSGCGKSSIGRALATQLECPFIEADSYHLPSSIEKMRQGIPLEDDDRWPWLEKVANLAKESAKTHGTVVTACSALKKRYREKLAEGEPPSLFIFLNGERDLIYQRMATRQHEYMPPSLLDSQIATLEVPDEDEPWPVLAVDIKDSPEQIISQLTATLTTLLKR